MTLSALFDRTLEIRRDALSSPGAVDEWNQPAFDADAVNATVDGLIQPLSIREVALLTDAGAQIGDFRAFLDAYHVAAGLQVATDVRSSDRLRDTVANAIYEIRSVLPTGPIDSTGQPHHYELVLRRVVD